MDPRGGEVTRLLFAYRSGHREALDELLPLIYEDLRRIARAQLRGQVGHTLRATGLVHEAYLRFVDQTSANWQDRSHFLSVCARAMRQIVISAARAKAAAKRGGGAERVPLEDDLVGDVDRADWLVALDAALERLAARDERLARVVECRYFAGLTEPETAEALDISLRTVQRDWMRARAWLRADLDEELEA